MIVRSVIAFMGLVALIVICCVVIFAGDKNHYEELDLLAARFDADPSEQHMRDLLNYPADGAYSYYKMALTGVAFTKNPDTLRRIYLDPHTATERETIEQLGSLESKVFEYYPSLKPSHFEERLSEQSWLIIKENKAEMATPRKPSDKFGS